MRITNLEFSELTKLPPHMLMLHVWNIVPTFTQKENRQLVFLIKQMNILPYMWNKSGNMSLKPLVFWGWVDNSIRSRTPQNTSSFLLKLRLGQRKVGAFLALKRAAHWRPFCQQGRFPNAHIARRDWWWKIKDIWTSSIICGHWFKMI